MRRRDARPLNTNMIGIDMPVRALARHTPIKRILALDAYILDIN
jgi:hypothetical protein